jgi:hypothetical protein
MGTDRARIPDVTVFVPEVGFRPQGTRELKAEAKTEEGTTTLRVRAVAASPDQTEVIVEWRMAGATCTPEHRYLSWKETPEPETAALVAGPVTLKARRVARQGYSASSMGLEAMHAITFDAIASDDAELRLTEGGHEFRVPFRLASAAVSARPLNVEAERDGVTVRATAVARHDDAIVVALEVRAPHQVRQVAAPLSTQVRFTDLDEETFRARQAEIRRVLGHLAEPIRLSTHMGEVEERGRVGRLEPQSDGSPPFLRRLAVVFPAPRDAKSATVIVPFVELNDPDGWATADLREVPQDVELGKHRFRILDTSRQGDEQRVVLEIPRSEASPRFSQPRFISGPGGDSYIASGVENEPQRRSMTVKAGDPPIVTFRGAVLRVEGPWRLEFPFGA